MFDRLADMNVSCSLPFANMHVDSGVQLTLINFWKNSGYITGSSIKKINGMIKKKFVIFKFKRPMSSFDSCEKFKWYKWKTFILYTTGAYLEAVLPLICLSNFMYYVRAFKINKLECIQMGVTYHFDILMTLFSNGLDIYRDSSTFTLKLHIAICLAGKSCRDWMKHLPKLFEHLNGIVAKGFHRRHDIEDQIIENFNYHR
jgi:hypothetical protein